MFNSIAVMPAVLGFAVVISIVISKYFKLNIIYILILISASILYQRETNRANMKTDNIEQTMINVSKFIIVTGISGYLVMRIMGLFLPGFD